MDGIISRLDVEQGERVVGTLQMAGTEMMRVADLSTIEVQVDVSENDVLRVNVGDPAEIEVDAYLDKMSASVDINTNTEKDVLTIPIQAVTTRDLNQMGKKKTGKKKGKKKEVEENVQEVVFVMEADTARMIQVKTGIQDDKYIQVLDGLKEEMEIIEGPYSVVSKKLEQGEELRVEE